MFRSRLSTLFLVTLTVACLASMFVFRFQTLQADFACRGFPADDTGLVAWLDEKYPKATSTVVREGNVLQIELSDVGRPSLLTQELPLKELGYVLATDRSIRYSTQPSPIRLALTILCGGLTFFSVLRNKHSNNKVN